MSESEAKVKDLRKRFRCPNCDCELSIGVHVGLEGLAAYDADDGKSMERWLNTLASGQKRIITRAQENGMLSAFEQACSVLPLESRPKNTAKFFLHFLQTCRGKMIPRFALNHYIKEFGGRQIETFGSNGILVVLSDKNVRAFLPYDLVKGENVKTLNGGGPAMRLDADVVRFEEWTRSRFGYVTGKGIFFDELRKSSIGEFARGLV